MAQPDWDHKHPGDYPAYTDSQHGPNLHTHGPDGKVDTIMGKSTNPLPAAAPALLAACEEALITTTERCRIERINPDSSPTVLCLRAAIEAAKGEK